MRTTVDLPDPVRRRVQALAERRSQSLSATVAELALRGLAQLDETIDLEVDSRSGFPVLRVGRRVNADDVADLLDDE
jgi:predicted transcriptional regulator